MKNQVLASHCKPLLLLGIFAIALSACSGSDDDTDLSNSAPSVSAGEDQTVNQGATVNLTGVASDSDGSISSWLWQQTSGSPSVTIKNSTTSNASFAAPEVDAETTLVFELEVKDNDGASVSDSMRVTVRGPGDSVNPLPDDFKAEAGDGQVTLTWSHYSSATYYNIYRSSASDCELANYTSCANGALFTSKSSPFTDTGLSNDTTYHYWIEAILEGVTYLDEEAISAIPVVDEDDDDGFNIDEDDYQTIYTHSDGTIYAVTKETMNWDDARAMAQEQGGDLVTIHNAAENDLVADLLESEMGWLGASDDSDRIDGAFETDYTDSEDGWRWIDGSELIYANWSSTQPDDAPNNDTSGSEDCLHTNWGSDGVWNDRNCVDQMLYAVFEFSSANLNTVFTENFTEGLSTQWRSYGSPSPQIVDSFAGKDYVFDNNGDSNYDSGVVSIDTFNFADKEIEISADVYVDFDDLSGCWNGAEIGLTAEPNPEVSSTGFDGSQALRWRLHAEGDACWATPSDKRRQAWFNFGVRNADGEWVGINYASDNAVNGDPYVNSWQNARIIISSDGMVKFLIGEELLWTSTEAVGSQYLDGKNLFLGLRSSGSAGKAYHDNINVKVSSVFTEDFADALSVQWRSYGSPAPQIVDSFAGKDYVFDNNGDSNYDSGVVSIATFNFAGKETEISADVYIDFDDLSGCWNGAEIGLTAESDPEVSSTGFDGSQALRWRLHAEGDACWATPSDKRRQAWFSFGVRNADSEWVGINYASDNAVNGDPYVNSWQNARIVIGVDGVADFLIGEELLWTSTEAIGPQYLDGKNLFLGLRSSGSAGKSYHDNVSVR